MLNRTHNPHSARVAQVPAAPRRRPGARGVSPAAPIAARVGSGVHALVRGDDNARLFDYEQRVRSAFDAIVPALKRISALQHEEDFETRAQRVARERLGFELPGWILADAWVEQLDLRRLYAWCVFETYLRFSDDFFSADPLGSAEEAEFQAFLQDCGFHILDISPCADGRLAHVIRYVLRLPYRMVRRKSYAGALFDIEDSLAKWGETELLRFREGTPNTADAPTRYLKAVVYHYSSSAPDTEGCAAHGSDAVRAAEAGCERLLAFQQAVENSYCCGASIDLLLIGLDTDTDAIRLHLPDGAGGIEPGTWVDAAQLYDETRGLPAVEAAERIDARLREAAPEAPAGMLRLLARLLENNLSQIEYVQRHHGGRYPDIGHAERFIGAGKGFEEVQLRNLTYFAYLDTVEEAAPDLDVGVKIFSRLNVGHGLPIPVVVRFDYHGQVPGARERAVAHCRRVAGALAARYPELAGRGLLHSLQLVRDIDAGGVGGRVEVLDCSVREPAQEAH
ncbi:carboxysome shell carbonic anhydrase [Thiohalobacter thiocyanaticus]|uniref:Carboxysome shell carbonic anhydrase n=1 Tax=Thiohalobacter thiocyanaticus TaxID=585455 RepID=A0A426QIE7_9GAMM|nr:carboxysome shell carbonic anhydrase [Thiohalobacter thiocyanaticus]RRQ21523.1 carboxysome shell carbonic anhydrase [Thiohalobacter thiocyanaticus]